MGAPISKDEEDVVLPQPTRTYCFVGFHIRFKANAHNKKWFFSRLRHSDARLRVMGLAAQGCRQNGRMDQGCYGGLRIFSINVGAYIITNTIWRASYYDYTYSNY